MHRPKGLPTSINNPPVITDLKPTNQTLFYGALGGLSFKASTVAPNRLDRENLRLILNGADVSAQLSVSGSSTDRTVEFKGLAANTVYVAHITVSDQAGRSASADLSFDTFSDTAGTLIEAEDYNYEGGKSLPAAVPAGYAGLTGAPDADYHDNNTTAAATEYRTADFVGLGVSDDGSRQRFTSVGATDYDVTGFVGGDWMNYTRTFENNAYLVYLRASAGRAQTIRLDRVTGDQGLPTQGRSPLGFFAVPNTPYTYVPLCDTAGQPVTLALGGVTTLRLTALESSSPSTQLNFLMLVPVEGPARPSYVSELVPAIDAMDVPQDAIVAATIVNGSSPVPLGNVTLTVNGEDVTSTASVTATTDGVQVTYDQPGSIALGAACSVRVAFTDAGGTAHAQDWTFTTRPYAPVITGVVETGGDDSEFTPAQCTGRTFSHPNLGTITVPTFREDVPAYRDRAHQWNGAAATLPLPSYLVGGDYIMIRNDNRDNGDLQIDVTVAAPALVYVLVDNRLNDDNAANPPDFSTGLMSWLEAEGWVPVRTGHNRLLSPALPDEVGVDESGDGIGAGAGVDSYSSVYVREVPAGTFSLHTADNAGRSMYGVVVRATATHEFAPVVEITSPAPEAMYPTTPATIAIGATASVRDSAVAKVEFIEAAAGKLGEALAAPYNFVWNNVLAGRYRLTARATAANGQVGVSQPVEVIVGTVISVNFQDGTAETPVGYLMDVGQVFGDQGNGYSYGWDADNAAYARNRDNVISPDERYDTFNHMQKDLPAGRVWEIELPNGNYSVHVVAGESDNYDGTFDIQAEGVTIVSGKPTATVRWFEDTAIVSVTDGRLSLSNGPTAVNNKVCYIDIARRPDTMPPAKFAPPTLSGNTVNLTWTGQGRLQEASQVNGPWSDVPGNPQNSYSVMATAPQKFYRVVSP
ncbi:MAG TPA: Ig-like domain-containing protein [Verrucomicrobiota bacterium]|nr:Ig-like domain-containing protein [Verrucomicrobiota bacterium]